MSMHMIASISDKISQVDRKSAELRKLHHALKSSKSDRARVEQQVSREFEAGKGLIRECTSMLRDIQYSGMSATTVDKVARDCQAAFDKFEKIAKVVLAEERTQIMIPQQESTNSGLGGDEGSAQAPLLASVSVDVSAAQAQERAAAMKQMESDLVSLHDLFEEISVLATVQQDQLDTIEAHVETTRSQVTKGIGDLEKAKKHQKSFRKKVCCLLCIVMIIAMCVIIPLLLTHHKS